MKATTVVVAGFPRSGTSLMCRLVSHMTGLPIFGSEYSGENTDWLELDPAELWPEARGKVVKALDPVALGMGRPPPDLEPRVIWMDRTPEVQARSAVRWLAFLSGEQVRLPIGPIAASLRRDRPRALRLFGGLPLHRVAFGDLVTEPEATLAGVAAFLGIDVERAHAAADLVERRSGDVLRPTLLEPEQFAGA